MVACVVSDPDAPVRPGVLEAIARASSPRVEPHDDRAVLFDVDGLARACGPPHVIAREITAMAAAEALIVRVALADTRTAAWILAHARPATTVVPAGQERAALADLPIGWLATVCDLDRDVRAASKFRRQVDEARRGLATFERWGLGTLGAVAALPRGDVHARLGPTGVRLHQGACGEDVAPLVPRDPRAPFLDRLELDWPIEGLDPLSFVLARQFDRLSAALERADRGATTVTTRLVLVTRAEHVRVLTLPAPIRDARVLRTLVRLDLESHPPPAGIDVIEIELGVMPGRIVQGSLLAPTLPSVENLSTLVARLGALVGASRIGAPVAPDTHDARQIAQVPFSLQHPQHPQHLKHLKHPQHLSVSFRRFPLPIPARVTLDRGVPVRVVPATRGLAGGVVVDRAGPWRSSGAWWALDASAWDRDEWDLALADGGVYRVARHRLTGAWDIEGAFD